MQDLLTEIGIVNTVCVIQVVEHGMVIIIDLQERVHVVSPQLVIMCGYMIN